MLQAKMKPRHLKTSMTNLLHIVSLGGEQLQRLILRLPAEARYRAVVTVAILGHSPGPGWPRSRPWYAEDHVARGWSGSEVRLRQRASRRVAAPPMVNSRWTPHPSN